MFVAVIVGAVGMLLITQLPGTVLGVSGILPGTKIYDLASPYIFVRGLTFIPAVVATVGFSAFRGTMDVVTPLKITLFTQMLNVIMDPLLIFGVGPFAAMGVTGASLNHEHPVGIQ
jgi:Na+-driven multidrug efflux pump